MTSVDLRDSPFYLLAADPTTSIQDLVEHQEEAIVEARSSEAELGNAHQRLVTPRLRLEAELSWLPGVPQAQTKEVVSLATTGPIEEARLATTSLPPMAAANVLAHLLLRAEVDAPAIIAIAQAWRQLVPALTIRDINAGRVAAGMPKVDLAQLSTAVASRQRSHIKAALARLAETKRTQVVLTRVLEELITTDQISQFIEILVHEYDAATESTLIEIREQIDQQVQLCRSDRVTPKSAVQTIGELLVEWDNVNQPAQLLSQALGHEEPRSEALSDDLRGLAIWLANDKEYHQDAFHLTTSLLRTFPELTSLAQRLRSDLETLAEILEHRRIEDLSRLKAALDRIVQNPKIATGHLRQHGLSPKAPEPIGSIASALLETKDELTTDQVLLPWMMVRAAALQLNNDHQNPDAARALIEAMLGIPHPNLPDSLRQKLEADRTTIDRNRQLAALGKGGGDLRGKIEKVDTLLLSATDDRDVLLKLRRRLRSRLVVRRVRASLVVAAVAGGAALVLGNQVDGPTPSFPRSPSSGSAATQASSPPPAASVTQTTTTNDLAEVPPPPAAGQLIGLAGLRYCMFQSDRLDVLRAEPKKNSEADRFNELVGDWNDRCGDYQYYPTDLRQGETEQATRDAQTRAESLAILAGWRATTPAAPRPAWPSDPRPLTPRLLDLALPADARLVQRRLQVLGHYGGAIDGIFGRGSGGALRAFKISAADLLDDEVWDIQTQRRVFGD